MSSSQTLRWSTVTAIYLCLTIAYCWPLLPAFDSGLPNDSGDPGLLAYIMWWNAKAVPYTANWWNMPMWVPVEGTLAFSDTMLGIAPLSSPLIWAGVGAVATYNTVFVAGIFTAALAAHALGFRLTGRHDAALIAGLAFGFNPYRASQMPHIQLLITCWMAFGLFALHRYLERRRAADLVMFGAAWALNGLTSGYYLVFFGVLVGFWMLWFLRDRSAWLAVLGTLAVASIPLLPILVGYQQIQSQYDMVRNRNEIESFSADLTGFLAASSHAWLPFQWSLEPRAEGELYPGLAIVILTLAVGVAAWRKLPRAPLTRVRVVLVGLALVAFALAAASGITGGLRLDLGPVALSLTRPHRIVTVGVWLAVLAIATDRRWADAWRRRSPFAFYALAALVMAVLALGPVGRVAGVRFLHQAPYSWLMEFPGGSSLRVPARFAMLMVLCLSVSAALAAARFWPGRMRARTLALLGLVVAADGWVPSMLVARTPQLVDLPGLAPGTVVLEVPIRNLWTDTEAMLRATRHGRPIYNGFSGYGPPHYGPMMAALGGGDTSVIATLAEKNPVAVLVNRRSDSGSHEAFVAKLDGATLAYRTPVGPVFRFSHVPAPPLTGRPLQYQVLRASESFETAWAMQDEAIDTVWSTIGPQETGDTFTIGFANEGEVSRLEMDLGDAWMNFPRDLQILARGDDGQERIVFRGGTGGPAVKGILEDRKRSPVVLALSPGTRARELTLTVMASDRDFYWSVAGLRAFGDVVR